MAERDAPVGFFDSGIGGVSVLREAVRLMPNENFLYMGDNANAPYGERSTDEILELTLSGVGHLVNAGVKALVVACNTATSVAAPTLRARLSMPIIAMEPALKPAQTLRRDGYVLVLATEATLRLSKFAALMRDWGQRAIPQPAPELVRLVERGVLCGDEVRAALSALVAPYSGKAFDAVVLGCTHFVFLRQAAEEFFGPNVAVVDGNEGTARQLRRMLAKNELLREGGCGSVELRTTGNPDFYLPLMHKLLAQPTDGVQCI